ncbi:MAG: hypothetical protein ACI88H_001404 [Cocleimonas sp.]|jgi:hypothetical protein
MSQFTINDGLHINITPRGAYYAVQDSAEDVTRQILIKLLYMDASVPLTDNSITDICEMELEDASSLIHRMQTLGLISGQKEVENAPASNLEDVLTDLLSSLSDSKKVLLAEHSGLYLGASGFPHEAAEELAAISANLSEVYERHKRLLNGNLHFNQRAWGLIDAAGNSEVGFWPMYVGYNQFALVIHGMPQLNRPTFKRLVWLLMRRYGAVSRV